MKSELCPECHGRQLILDGDNKYQKCWKCEGSGVYEGLQEPHPKRKILSEIVGDDLEETNPIDLTE
tara:strand:- start:1897 stop:2094 length:198 start_codon:yes stop_codon:yes gene_type:complete